ncbi:MULTISPECIES: DUF4368 domain-containing protein [unclassified Neglectibacter]|uniref:DUF4368 domain-containing protein n=1 Tax=unclassified Neglectibacter TaxID=2632164 RepID=UPI001EF10B61|nr:MULTISPECIES: DUF4368 domain-containing protein [unclassified Neglectibacter]
MIHQSSAPCFCLHFFGKKKEHSGKKYKKCAAWEHRNDKPPPAPHLFYIVRQSDRHRWLEIIRRYTEISELDETILFELVDRIEVGDTQIINGQRICEVKVYYRYVGNVDAALAQERGQDYGEAI